MGNQSRGRREFYSSERHEQRKRDMNMDDMWVRGMIRELV